MKKNNSSGLTVIELLVASAIAVCFFGGLLAAKVSILEGISTVSQERRMIVKLNRLYHCLKSDLICSQEVEIKESGNDSPNPGFFGAQDRVSFYSSNPRLETPYARSIKSIYRVSYCLEKDTGDRLGLELVRKVVPLFRVATSEEKSMVIINGVESLVFNFSDGKNWFDSWDKELLPRGVRVVVGTDTLFFDIPCGEEEPS